MSFVCHLHALVFQLHVRVYHSCVSRMYPYVTRMSFACTRMSSVCQQHVLLCHPYVTHMYSYIICMSLVCTWMPSVCHSYVLVCHSYVTGMYVLVCHHMSLACGFTMNRIFFNSIKEINRLFSNGMSNIYITVTRPTFSKPLVTASALPVAASAFF